MIIAALAYTTRPFLFGLAARVFHPARMPDADGKITATTLDFDADIYTEGKYVAYRIPLEAIGATSASEIGLKVSDNIFAGERTAANDGVGVYSFGDLFAFYCGGDCAPAGRLNYSYRMGY